MKNTIGTELLSQRQAPCAKEPLSVTGRAFKDGMKALHRLGITGIHDIRLMADDDGGRSFQCCQKLEQNGLLDLRC